MSRLSVQDIFTRLIILKQNQPGNDDYIIQRINTNVFRDPDAVMQNISLVTSHIIDKLRTRGEADLKRRVLHPVGTMDGKLNVH